MKRAFFLAVSIFTMSVLPIETAYSVAGHRLVGTVPKTGALTLVDSSGRAVTTLRVGVYTIAVRDRSARRNFRLISPDPALARSTGLRFIGTVTWTVRLTRGVYHYGSDRQAGAQRSFRVVR